MTLPTNQTGQEARPAVLASHAWILRKGSTTGNIIVSNVNPDDSSSTFASQYFNDDDEWEQ